MRNISEAARLHALDESRVLGNLAKLLNTSSMAHLDPAVVLRGVQMVHGVSGHPAYHVVHNLLAHDDHHIVQSLHDVGSGEKPVESHDKGEYDWGGHVVDHHKTLTDLHAKGRHAVNAFIHRMVTKSDFSINTDPGDCMHGEAGKAYVDSIRNYNPGRVTGVQPWHEDFFNETKHRSYAPLSAEETEQMRKHIEANPDWLDKLFGGRADDEGEEWKQGKK